MRGKRRTEDGIMSEELRAWVIESSEEAVKRSVRDAWQQRSLISVTYKALWVISQKEKAENKLKRLERAELRKRDWSKIKGLKGKFRQTDAKLPGVPSRMEMLFQRL